MKARRKRIPKPFDPHAGREASRRFAANVSTAILVVGTVLALVVVSNKWLSREELRSVRIIGRTILDSAEIMEQAAIPAGTSLQKLDLQGVESRIASHPFIARASVYRGENGTLVVEVAERAPVAVTMIGGTPIYLDSSAFGLPYRFSSAGFDVPIVSGVVDGTSIDTLHAREALGVAGSLRAYDETLYREISEIRREPDGQYTFLSADGAVPIRAGLPADIPARLAKLDAFLTRVLASVGTGRADYIDLRWDGQVVVKWHTVETRT
jgi:cell division protein FtsQ